jgi:hypothetical protein
VAVPAALVVALLVGLGASGMLAQAGTTADGNLGVTGNDGASDAVRPVLECVAETPDGYVAHFGYLNEHADVVTVPVGPDNKFSPSPADRGQPTAFQPGRVVEAFVVGFDGGTLVWTLDGRTATASPNSRACAR